MVEDNQVKSKRDAQIERLRNKHPEKRFEDDEEIYGQISDDYDQYEHDLGEYRKQEKTLSDMFDADPRSAEFLVAMHRGEDPVVGLVRNFGIEIKDVLDDPAMQDKIAEANKEYVERVAKSKELDAEYERNMATTLDTLREFQRERGMTDEQIDAVVDALLQIVRDGVMGKFDVSTLDMMTKAINHDSDVTIAAEEGRVAGRNDKIVEGLRRREQGDGVSPLGGKNGQQSARRSRNMFDLASEAM